MGLKSIAFFDADGKCLYNGKLSSMQFKEESVIGWSEEFFNDDEPCIIHRSFIIKKMIFEMETFLLAINGLTFYELDWDSVPEKIRHLPGFKGIKSVHWEM